MKEPSLPSITPKVVLGIAAHPDDLDYYAGGTMAAYAKQGAKVYYLILTDGSKGSSDPTMTPDRLRDIRREEQRKAGAVLGITDVFFCDYPDGMLENSGEVKRDVVKVIRQVKPDVVVAMDPTVVYFAQAGIINHPDHRAAGQAAVDAVYPLARDHMSFPELLAGGYEPHNTKTLLLIGFDQTKANFAVNITDTLEQKYQALAEHQSQLVVQDLKEGMSQLAAKAGAPYGYSYAEYFTRIDIH